MGNTATRPQSSMSNGQMQTRGLSAADWTRLKRLRGARANANSYSQTVVNIDGVLTTNKDINPPPFPQLPYGRPIQVYRSVGTSKIRRPASDWIAYRASQTADYPTPSGKVVPFVDSGTLQVMTRLCSCSNSVLETKIAGCSKCRHNPVENYTPDTTPSRPVGNGLTYAAYVVGPVARYKPDLLDGAGSWGTQDNARLSLPGFSGLATTDFIPYYYDGSPGGMNDYDNVSIYMFGFFRAPVTGTYIFTVESDDGLQIAINPGNLIINQPGQASNGGGTSTPISLTGGVKYPFDALWSNGSGAIKFIITDITVNGQSLPNNLGIPIKECFFTS